MDPAPPSLSLRRSASMPDLVNRKPSCQDITISKITTNDLPRPFLPPRKPSSAHILQAEDSGGPSYEAPQASLELPNWGAQRRPSNHRPHTLVGQPLPDPRVQAVKEHDQANRYQDLAQLKRPLILHHSPLRIENRPPDGDKDAVSQAPVPSGIASTAPLSPSHMQEPHSNPPAGAANPSYGVNTTASMSLPAPVQAGDAGRHGPMRPFLSGTQSSPEVPQLRPRMSFRRLSSLDNILIYRGEVAAWKRDPSTLQQRPSNAALNTNKGVEAVPLSTVKPGNPTDMLSSSAGNNNTDGPPASEPQSSLNLIQKSKFRHIAAEIGFCFSVAMCQLLCEYLLSGFAIELYKLFQANPDLTKSNLGTFWPASLLSLIEGATLLIFARISDLYGGYYPFMLGLIWLFIWTLIPTFIQSLVVLNISRAMQGLSVATFTPSTFVMVTSVYQDGPRKNFVLGLFSGCAPLGFFIGFLTAGALPLSQTYCYFWIEAVLSFITIIVAYLSVPHEKIDRKQLGLKMDWLGAFLITGGLILLAYGLAVSTYANGSDPTRSSFSYPMVYAPFASGIVCLAAAVWVEGWFAKCPLMPFDFFRPRSVAAFCIAGLFLYATYGVWLYNSTAFFQSDTGTVKTPVTGIELAVWYSPIAIFGLLMCVISGSLLHIIRIKVLLLISGLAWIISPLLLAVCPYPVKYWSVVLPSMICTTLGLDMTYTISLVFFSYSQPQRYQGLCGAVSGIIFNIAISFGLSVTEMVKKRAQAAKEHSLNLGTQSGYAVETPEVVNWTYRAAFLYATATAGVGFVLCVLFVRISASVGREKPADEEQSH